MSDASTDHTVQARLSFLAEASHVLASSLDFGLTLQQAARLTIPTLADACVMYLIKADGAAETVAVAHARASEEEALWELQRRYPDPAGSRGALGRVLASGESVCFPDSDPVARLARARDDLHRRLLERLNTYSAMIVPMVARGQVIGALSLMTSTSVSGRQYSAEDVSFAEDLARRCALAVDNARLYDAAQTEIAQRRRVEQQLASLQAVSAKLAATLDPAALAEMVVEELSSQFGYDRPSVYFLTSTGCLELAAYRGSQRPPTQSLPESDGIAVPITRADQVLGIINLQKREDGALGEDDIHLVTSMAEVVAVAMENARLLRAAQDEIAERKRAEAALAELTRTKEELISMISHELRSPATVLIGYAELLAASETEPTSETERRDIAAAIVQQGQQLSKLVDDFLEVQRLGRAQLSVQPRPMDLRPLLDRLVIAARCDAAHPVRLELSGSSLHVTADPVRVEQALVNLLSNARKYSPGGGAIAVMARDHADHVEISVVDQGLGIPREALPRVFDRFYRVDTDDRRGISGTGLGLAVVRELTEAQGGHIGVDSEGVGKGSRFWFTLPIASSSALPEHPPVAPLPKKAEPGRLRLLAVDDEPAIGAMLRRGLRADGHVVDFATSVAEALDYLSTRAYDVVVSDLHLPGDLDGLGLAERVRDAWPSTRFVLASGSIELDAPNARARGAHAILRKPYELDDLRRVLAA